jgi:hypothetical protein
LSVCSATVLGGAGCRVREAEDEPCDVFDEAFGCFGTGLDRLAPDTDSAEHEEKIIRATLGVDRDFAGGDGSFRREV